MEIPVYLFTGFLEAGKTKFLQETLEDSKFNAGEKTLVLLCEEGEYELELSKLPGEGKNISIVTFDDEQKLTQDRLTAAQKRTGAVRCIIEYNGMWNIDSIYNALPQSWFVCEEITLMDSSTILAYNSNMRQLVYDKLKSAQMVIFNRVPNIDPNKDNAKFNNFVMPLHKLVRAANRRANIGYETVSGNFTTDNIEDPLPFNLEDEIVKIKDEDYAFWYSHISENMEMYEGKSVSFKGMVARDDSMPKDTFAIGRQIMTCCEADTAYRPLVAKIANANTYKMGDWVTVTGTIHIGKSKYYQTKGPILTITSIEKTVAPLNPVATFN